nr:TonB-dependent receptor [Immundisolibacter cernigliae]
MTANNLGLTGTLSYYNVENLTRLQLFPRGAFGGMFPDGVLGNPDVYERHYRGELSVLYTGIARHRLRLGGGYRKEDLYRVEESRNYTLVDLGAPFGTVPVPLGGLVDVTDLAAFVREENRTIAYAFAQDEWNFRRDWTLTTGVRVDDYSDFGTTVNPRLALVWQTSYALTTKLLYGRAFRAPSFQELYAVNNPANLGNSSLNPETINTWELGLDWDAGRGLRAAANVFYYKMDDIIRFAAEGEAPALPRRTPAARPATAWKLNSPGRPRGACACPAITRTRNLPTRPPTPTSASRLRTLPICAPTGCSPRSGVCPARRPACSTASAHRAIPGPRSMTMSPSTLPCAGSGCSATTGVCDYLHVIYSMPMFASRAPPRSSRTICRWPDATCFWNSARHFTDRSGLL